MISARTREPKWAAAIVSSCSALFPMGAFAQNAAPATPIHDVKAASSSAPASNSDPEPMVWVHLDGPGGLRLQQDLDSIHHGDWNTVCVAPCDTWVPASLDFR